MNALLVEPMRSHGDLRLALSIHILCYFIFNTRRYVGIEKSLVFRIQDWF